MKDVPGLKISKLDAARRQLETAVTLYFHEADPVSIHTLAAAAYDVLRDLCRARGTALMIKDWVADYVKPEFVREIRDALNASQNFLKHADRDSDAILALEPGQAEFLLLDACWAYRRLASERLLILGVFEARASLTWASTFLTYDGMETIPSESRERWAGLSRQAFFDQFLSVAYEASVKRPDA
jgi:hypothetical protein